MATSMYSVPWENSFIRPSQQSSKRESHRGAKVYEVALQATDREPGPSIPPGTTGTGSHAGIRQENQEWDR